MKFLQLSAAMALLALSAHATAPVTSISSESLCNSDSETSTSRCPQRLKIATEAGAIVITPYTDDIFKVTTYPKGDNTPAPVSQSAVLRPTLPASALKISSDGNGVTISSKTTTLKVNRADGRISFYDKSGKLLLSEAGGIDNNNAKDRRISFAYTSAGEKFYGAGERGHSLTLNGDTLEMYNRQNYGYTGSDPRVKQMNITVPFFTSSKGYGVLFDDHTKSTLIMGDPIQYISRQAIGPLSYYFINGGGTLAGTASGYAALTGKQGLPPFWALGYITSKYGYHNQAETLGAIDSLRTCGYPVDGIVLDLYWYGVETDMGKLQWDKTKWPDHKKMLSDLKKQGVNLIAITQPYINKIGAIDNYNYLVDNGMTVRDAEGNNHDVTTWVGDAGMFDISNPQTREWYWNRYRDLTEDGIAAWWGDLGEPEVHPSTIRHYNGMTAEQYHNVYGNEWSRIIYEGFRNEFPERRIMLLMRGGTAGLQRYNVFPWTTDVSRSWGGFEPQVKLMVGSGLSGLGYMSSDIGGFAVDPAHPTDPELYVRWLQMGAFTPMLRTHAQLKPEPYHYPKQEAITKKFIKMRYEWLPYNYTLAYENAAKGWPLARPLNFHGENSAEKYANISDEYLWGDNVLVAPVMTKGARSHKVIFPAGEWIDFYNNALKYKGGTTATVQAPLDKLPLFVRAGSFIPQYTLPLENVTQYDPAHLTMRYYPCDKETTYVLYDDNRISPTALEDGDYMLTTFTGEKTPSEIGIKIKSDKNPDLIDWMPSVRNITFQIEGVQKKPSQISVGYDGSVLIYRDGGWKYDAKTRVLTVDVEYRGGYAYLLIR
ncbi:MAG: DUF4968 domain-containing protein [Prevotella sp.]|nr:DUF4968 domain-containing protein [Prevotella sp.]MCM1075064.1 DUF4968 domain-containing protein [Ruminococcus sp.]